LLPLYAELDVVSIRHSFQNLDNETETNEAEVSVGISKMFEVVTPIGQQHHADKY
jgi:hypothetical protein